MKKTINFIIMLFALLTVTSYSFAQDIAETENITKYLESTIEYRGRLIVSSTSQAVLASDISECSLTFNTGQRDGNIIQEQYFIKSGDKITPHKTLNNMLSSNEFMGSIKTKKFRLNTDEDGLAFQSMLRLIDQERGLGFFKEDNSWYFIRSKFFDDIEAFIVSTDEKGQISSVVFVEKLKKEIPKTFQKSNEIAAMKDAANMAAKANEIEEMKDAANMAAKSNEIAEMKDAANMVSKSVESVQNVDSTKRTIFQKDSVYMHNYLLDDLNYVFEISPQSLNSVNRISTISVYKCALKITDEVAILKDPFLLVVNNKEYTKQSSGDKVIKMPLFIKSLQENYKIKTEVDAKLFLNVLDDLELFTISDNNLKTFYKKENVWVFVRKKHLDDLEGYILLVDKGYRVSYIEYTTVSDENIARIRKKGPDFQVD